MCHKQETIHNSVNLQHNISTVPLSWAPETNCPSHRLVPPRQRHPPTADHNYNPSTCDTITHKHNHIKGPIVTLIIQTFNINQYRLTMHLLCYLNFLNVLWPHFTNSHLGKLGRRGWLMLVYLLIECFTTTFLHTHSWINWGDEDDWWGWGWLDRKARRH